MKHTRIVICFFLFILLVQVLPTLSFAQVAITLNTHDYENTVWQFGRGDGSIITQRLTLLPGGKIEGYYHPNEDHWGVEDGYLVFYHKNGEPTCRFSSSLFQDNRMILRGKFLLVDNVTHVLKEIGWESTEKIDFTAKNWQFGRGDGSIIAHKIRLLAGGKIEGYYHPNEDHWGVEDGHLVFYHQNGEASCRFTSSRLEDGRVVLSGKFLLFNNINVIHVLTETN